jgi:hypothetical protein
MIPGGNVPKNPAPSTPFHRETILLRAICYAVEVNSTKRNSVNRNLKENPKRKAS